MSASLMRLFHLAGASASHTLSFTGEVFCDRAAVSVNICPAIRDDSEDIPLRQKWNDTTYFDLDHGSCSPVLSKLTVRPYVAIPVPSRDNMTKQIIFIRPLYDEISGLMILFHVSYAFRLVSETTLY
jgi:hypothetical protein